MEHVYNKFVSFMGEGTEYSNISEDIVEKYKNTFLGPKDEEDIIVDIWRKYSLRGYKNGLFWFVNPDEYNDLARLFPDVSESAIVFARSASGCMFLWEKYKFGHSIAHLNVHNGKKNIISSNFDMFLKWNLRTPTFWKKQCYGNVEFKIIEKLDPVSFDESYAFVPALALGGSKSVTKMEKMKIKEHLELLSQLF